VEVDSSPLSVSTRSAPSVYRPIYYIGDISLLIAVPLPLVYGRWEEGEQASNADV